jgi:indole-3-glycerol phosphate synthase
VKLLAEIGDIDPAGGIREFELGKFDVPTVIAEIKFASPNGRIYAGTLDHRAIAKEYLENGAAAISVLTEPDFFGGSIEYLRDVRETFPKAHILLKDFVLDERQIYQGARNGASAILLISAFIGDRARLRELYNCAVNLGVTPFVEVHDLDDLDNVLDLTPPIIGVNNRSIKTLRTNLDASRNLIDHIPDDCCAICASGIENDSQIREMADIGFDGFLIGSSLMRHDNPGAALRTLLGKCSERESL